MSLKKIISKISFSVHSCLGLISGVFLLLLGLSGSALVFLDEIDKALNEEHFRIEQEGMPLPLDSLYRIIASRRPNLAGIAWLNPDAAVKETYEFRLYQNDGKVSTYDLGIMNINPYSGEILREADLKDLDAGIIQWILQFHWSLQLGVPGLVLATVFGISMLLSTLTGLIIYRKFVWRVLLFKVKISWKNWRTVSAGLHRVIGVWAMIFNMAIFFTGFWMNKFSLDGEYWKKQTVSSPANRLAQHSIDWMFQKAKKSMPDLIVKNVYMPTQAGKNFRISGTLRNQLPVFHNGNSVSVDPVSGTVMSIDRLADKGIWKKTEATFLPLHAGSYGGGALKILYVILGLVPGLLSITGALLWWRRAKKHRRILAKLTSGA